MLEIVVSDPEKHDSLPKAYVDFKISTVTDLANFTQHEFFVRRRFRDFQWLREQLCAAFPAAIVPPLPQVDSLLKDDRFSVKFIIPRQAGLNLFLQRVAGHPVLSKAQALQTFLEAKVWELETAKAASSSTASVSSSWMSALFDGTDASLKKMGVRQEYADDPDGPKLKAFSPEYATIVKAAADAHRTAVETCEKAATDLDSLAPAVNKLSQSETELSQPFTDMAATLHSVRELLEKHVAYEHVSGLSSTLAFHAGMATSLKTVLANRSRALDHYQRARAVADASRSEHQAWAAQQSQQQSSQENSQAQPRPNTYYGKVMSGLDWMLDDAKKGGRLEQKTSDAEGDLAEAKQVWENISSTIHGEVDAFHRTTNDDLSQALREHALRQIEFEEAQQAHWLRLLEVFEAVPCPTAMPMGD